MEDLNIHQKIKIVLKDENGGRVPRVEIPSELIFTLLPDRVFEEVNEDFSGELEESFRGMKHLYYDVEVIQ